MCARNGSGLSPRDIRCMNTEAVALVSRFLNLAPTAIDAEMIASLVEDVGLCEERAYAECLGAICGLDTAGADKLFFRNYFLPMVRQCDVDAFRSDRYRKAVGAFDARDGAWRLGEGRLEAYEAFVCDDFLTLPDGRMIPQLGFFRESFTYPAVYENGREWMTLLPNEQVTMREPVSSAFGKVLTYGLGLGYFAFLASEKENVSSVTVVEADLSAERLFRRFILPKFPHKEKLRIIHADAFEYAKGEMWREEYDFVFADIWHDAGDGREAYLRLRETERLSPQTKFAYWIEKTIQCYLDESLWKKAEDVN